MSLCNALCGPWQSQVPYTCPSKRMDVAVPYLSDLIDGKSIKTRVLLIKFFLFPKFGSASLSFYVCVPTGIPKCSILVDNVCMCVRNVGYLSNIHCSVIASIHPAEYILLQHIYCTRYYRIQYFVRVSARIIHCVLFEAPTYDYPAAKNVLTLQSRYFHNVQYCITSNLFIIIKKDYLTRNFRTCGSACQMSSLYNYYSCESFKMSSIYNK